MITTPVVTAREARERGMGNGAGERRREEMRCEGMWGEGMWGEEQQSSSRG
jgi:hypothetical protein